ncbi:2-oxoglutarate/malate transporter [Streptomyces sp. NPDC014894]|uniref:2-oxoglutarate/malate transporter n=1 Tax=unclassified Streptomyces TaxID=2593676 RepID=UPI0036F7EF59
MMRKILPPTPMNLPRIGGFAAIGFAFTIALGNMIMVPAGLPRTGSELADVTAFFGAKPDIVGIGSAVTPAAWVLATLFGAGAYSALSRSGRDDVRAWAVVGCAGLLLQNGLFAGVVATRLALTTTGAPDDPGTAALWALHDTLFTLNGTFLALALLGLSAAGCRAGLIRPWHAALGLLAAALLFTSATLTPLITQTPGPLGLLGLTGWLLWLLWTTLFGLTLIRPSST